MKWIKPDMYITFDISYFVEIFTRIWFFTIIYLVFDCYLSYRLIPYDSQPLMS